MFINDTDLFTRFVDTFFFLFLFIDGSFLITDAEKNLVLQILLYFQGKKRGGCFY